MRLAVLLSLLLVTGCPRPAPSPAPRAPASPAQPAASAQPGASPKPARSAWPTPVPNPAPPRPRLRAQPPDPSEPGLAGPAPEAVAVELEEPPITLSKDWQERWGKVRRRSIQAVVAGEGQGEQVWIEGWLAGEHMYGPEWALVCVDLREYMVDMAMPPGHAVAIRFPPGRAPTTWCRWLVAVGRVKRAQDGKGCLEVEDYVLGASWKEK
ncbi:MAG: hypothetical protein AB7N76_24280 [Planctomycetota bacterium]